MADEEKTEIYRTTYEELKQTHQNQLDAHHKLNQRSIDLAKIDILAASVIASAATIVPKSSGSLLLISGVVSLLVSLGYCIQVYRPRKFPNGLPPEAADIVQDFVDNGNSVGEYYKRIMASFHRMVEESEEPYNEEVRYFRNALWSSVSGILFLIATLLRPRLPHRCVGIDILLIFLITLLVIGVRRLNEEQ